MLSTENPPLDLPRPCEISQLQNTSTDERASDKNHHQLEVDLLKSGLDDEEDNNSTNPVPKFSLRDYVFDTRGKDIKNNWPFSRKNLQLCLKYGVKDVLPPFQSLDSVRNPSTEKCVTENFSYSDVKLSELSNCSVGQKLALDIENINSSKPEEDKEHPSTTRSQFCSDLNPVPQSTNPFVEQESEYTPVKKVKSNTQNLIKKCRLILKSNKIAERKSNENLSANSSAASEATMASKVCPVCKTFSSSSNTTLNAHIDQCLSGESTVKWTAANTKVIKHRIKPRKTKLMVDIYETALQCTLEDLDRRNGTNWASNLCFPAHVSKTCAEVNVGNSNEKGDVCTDSKSPKLRSLSKLNDLPSISAAKYDSGPSKLVEKDKDCKFVSGKKKKCLVQKLKLSKHPIYGQRSCSPIPDHSPEPQVNNGQIKQCLTSNDRMKSDNLGIIKPWVGSKRTGPKKKINLEHENQHSDKIVNYSKENGCPSESLLSTPKPATESHKRKENLLCNSRYGSKEQPCQRKRPGFSSLMSPEFHVKKSHLVRKDRPSVHELNADPPNATQNNDCSRSNKKMRIDVNPAVNTNSSFISSRISQPRAFPSQGKESGSKKFSSLRKKFLSVRRTSVPESKKNYGKKHLDFKKPCHNYTSGSDEEVVVSRSAIYRQDNVGQMKRASDKPSINGTTVPKIRKKRRKLVKAGKGDVSLKDSEETSPEPDSDDVGKNVSSFVCELTCKIADGEDFIAFSKSLDSTFDRISGPSNVERVSQQEMFCSDNAVRDLVAPAETDADEAKRNYFVDVDPIPIPGPPGSFLPSPRRMCSEDLQGNSSLTTCKIQSSEDEHEVIDMDSSDSPISARSYSGSVVNLSAKSHNQNRTQCDIFEQAANAERELILEETKANSMCCCSRKDRAIQSGSLIYQDSQLLRRRTMTSPEKEKHVADVPKNRIHGSNLGYSETLNAANSPMGYAPVIASHNSEAKFVDYEFPSPSTPHNPVLRLMGKNLMVVSKDENQLSSPQTNPWFCADNDLSTCNNRSEPHSFDRSLPRGHSMFENSLASMPTQHFDFMKSPANYRPSQLPSHPSAQMLSSTSTFGGSFIAPSPKYYENGGGYNLIHDQISGPNIMRSLDTGRMYHDTDAQLKTADSCGSKYKKIHCMETTEGSYVGITSSSSSSMESRYDHQRLVSHHPFYGYPVYNGHPSMVQNNGNIQVPVSNGITNANLGKWNCSITPEGSSNLMHPNSLTAASLPSISHLRSSLYFSPGF